MIVLSIGLLVTASMAYAAGLPKWIIALNLCAAAVNLGLALVG